MKKTITTLFVLTLLSLAAKQSSLAATLNLKLYIEGYYVGSGFMRPELYHCGGSTFSTYTDTILVELHGVAFPSFAVASYKGVLLKDGAISCTFSNSLIGKAFYIVVKHRSTIETWSAVPVTLNAVANYDFSSAASQAYGNNMVYVDGALKLWALYSGDLNQDGKINLKDYPVFSYRWNINNGMFGCYKEDLNGDGNVDLLDFSVLDKNIIAGVFSRHP